MRASDPEMREDFVVIGMQDFPYKFNKKSEPQLERSVYIADLMNLRERIQAAKNDKTGRVPIPMCIIVMHIHTPWKWATESKKPIFKRDISKVTQVNIRHLTRKGYDALGKKYHKQNTQVDGGTKSVSLSLSPGANAILQGRGVDITALAIDEFEEKGGLTLMKSGDVQRDNELPAYESPKEYIKAEGWAWTKPMISFDPRKAKNMTDSENALLTADPASIMLKAVAGWGKKNAMYRRMTGKDFWKCTFHGGYPARKNKRLADQTVANVYDDAVKELPGMWESDREYEKEKAGGVDKKGDCPPSGLAVSLWIMAASRYFLNLSKAYPESLAYAVPGLDQLQVIQSTTALRELQETTSADPKFCQDTIAASLTAPPDERDQLAGGGSSKESEGISLDELLSECDETFRAALVGVVKAHIEAKKK
eukprot:g1531.t1